MKHFILLMAGYLFSNLLSAQMPVISGEQNNSTIDKLLLKDDFSSNKNAWILNNSADELMAIRNGQMEFYATAKTLYTKTTINVIEKDNYWITAKLQHADGIQNNSYGIIFGAKDNQNYYCFAIAANGYFCLFKLENGVLKMLQNWTLEESINTGNGINILSVKKYDNAWFLFVNGIHVDIHTVTPLFGNGYGFYCTAGQKIFVDDLIVRQVPAQKYNKRKEEDGESRYVKKTQEPPINNNTGKVSAGDTKSIYCIELLKLVNHAENRFTSITNLANPQISSILRDTTFTTSFMLPGSKSAKIVRSSYDGDIEYVATIDRELEAAAAEALVQKLQKDISGCLTDYQMKPAKYIRDVIIFEFIAKQELANERLAKPQVHIEKTKLLKDKYSVEVIVITARKPTISDDFLNRTYEPVVTKGRVTTGLCAQLTELLNQAPVQFKDVRNSNYKNDDGTRIYPASYKLEGSQSSEVRISTASYSHESKIINKITKDAALEIYKQWIVKLKNCLGTRYNYTESVEENKFYQCSVRIKNDNDSTTKIDLACRPNMDGTYYVEISLYRFAD